MAYTVCRSKWFYDDYDYHRLNAPTGQTYKYIKCFFIWKKMNNLFPIVLCAWYLLSVVEGTLVQIAKLILFIHLTSKWALLKGAKRDFCCIFFRNERFVSIKVNLSCNSCKNSYIWWEDRGITS